jgi:hypothetical protein
MKRRYEVWVGRKGKPEIRKETYELSEAGAVAASNAMNGYIGRAGVTTVTWKRIDETGDRLEREHSAGG